MDFTTVAASVVSSVSARLVFHPIDTLRTMSQTTGGPYLMPLPRYWAGLLPGIGLSVPGFTVYLVAYRQSKASLSPHLGPTSITNYVISGTIAEVMSSGIWTPTEVIKGRLQIAKQNESTAQMLRSIYRAEGLRGFFHGYFMGLAVFIPHSVVLWVTYERVREALARRKQGPLTAQDHALSAATANATAVVCTNFLDVVKTRQQLAHSPEVARLRPDDIKGVRAIATTLIREHGFARALTKGMLMRLLSTVPSSALAMAIMETLHPDPLLLAIQED